MKLKNVLYMLSRKKLTHKYLFDFLFLRSIQIFIKLIDILDKIIFIINLKRRIRIKKNKLDFDIYDIELYVGILIKDRPQELMNLYLSIKKSLKNSIQKVNITLFDDCSTDLKTLEVIDTILNENNNVTLVRRQFSDNSWSSAHNWAINNLLKVSKNKYDIIGTIDSDMVLAKNWVQVIFKSIFDLNYHNKLPVQYIGIFNSNDVTLHKWKEIVEINGTKYVLKLRMGGATIFFSKINYQKFKNSILMKNGKHLDNLEDESRMTRKMLIRGKYYASTLESFAEHNPHSSLLDIQRNVCAIPTKALNLSKCNFEDEIIKLFN